MVCPLLEDRKYNVKFTNRIASQTIKITAFDLFFLDNLLNLWVELPINSNLLGHPL